MNLDKSDLKAIDTIVCKRIDERVSRIVDVKVNNIIDKKVPKIVDEKVNKIVDNKVDKIVTKRVDEGVEFLARITNNSFDANEKAHKLIREDIADLNFKLSETPTKAEIKLGLKKS